MMNISDLLNDDSPEEPSVSVAPPKGRTLILVPFIISHNRLIRDTSSPSYFAYSQASPYPSPVTLQPAAVAAHQLVNPLQGLPSPDLPAGSRQPSHVLPISFNNASPHLEATRQMSKLSFESLESFRLTPAMNAIVSIPSATGALNQSASSSSATPPYQRRAESIPTSPLSDRSSSLSVLMRHGKMVEMRKIRPHLEPGALDRPHKCIYFGMDPGTLDNGAIIKEACYARFRRRQEMLRHIRSVHGADEDKLWVCPGGRNTVCGRRFARADALRKHLDSLKCRQEVDGCSYGLNDGEVAIMIKNASEAK
ncbi:hypothetical protein BC830DRAFT_914830 [Chytriomyces sp. MP71]|nr:hypothetical protein BC830DRAFT_914830 [Chytriomyces sp. MP71]